MIRGNIEVMIEAVKAALTTIHPPPLALEDAETIVALAQLVVDIDGREGADEIHVFFGIGRILFDLAGKGDLPIPTFASDLDDDERMFELATAIKATPVRELAFCVARLLAAADLDVAPEEESFIDRLRGILEIDKTRAATLAVMMRDARAG